jgi:hypothetical protein
MRMGRRATFRMRCQYLFITSFFAGVGLIGCTGPRLWVKQGATQSNYDRDRTTCWYQTKHAADLDRCMISRGWEEAAPGQAGF